MYNNWKENHKKALGFLAPRLFIHVVAQRAQWGKKKGWRKGLWRVDRMTSDQRSSAFFIWWSSLVGRSEWRGVWKGRNDLDSCDVIWSESGHTQLWMVSKKSTHLWCKRSIWQGRLELARKEIRNQLGINVDWSNQAGW